MSADTVGVDGGRPAGARPELRGVAPAGGPVRVVHGGSSRL
jgi:hypothetical protein